ncbi:MAG: hypothetical protein AABW58_03900 [Nanoarchaeota archaeon]
MQIRLKEMIERRNKERRYVDSVMRFFNEMTQEEREAGERQIIYLDRSREKWVSKCDQRVIDKEIKY